MLDRSEFCAAVGMSPERMRQIEADFDAEYAKLEAAHGEPRFEVVSAKEFCGCTPGEDMTQSMVVEHLPENRFEFREAADYVTGAPLRWLIPGVLPQAELVVVYGASGSGKSFLTYDMCVAISRGALWAGRETTQGRVAYIAAEGGHGMQNRIKAYAERHGGFEGLPAMSRVAPNLMEAKDALEIANAMAHTGPYVAVVIDTLSRSHQGNENSGEDMGLVLKYCQQIHRATGAVVVLIHHSGKDESKGQRGWSGLRAAADAEIEVTRDPAGNRAWIVSKMKDGADEGVGAPFRLDVVPLGLDGESSCVVSHDVGISKTAAPKRRRPKGNALLVLQCMEQQFTTQAPEFEDLLEAVGPQLLCHREGRRKEYLRDAIAKLADTETDKWLWRHAGDRVALTSVLPGSANDEPF